MGQEQVKEVVSQSVVNGAKCEICKFLGPPPNAGDPPMEAAAGDKDYHTRCYFKKSRKKISVKQVSLGVGVSQDSPLAAGVDIEIKPGTKQVIYFRLNKDVSPRKFYCTTCFIETFPTIAESVVADLKLNHFGVKFVTKKGEVLYGGWGVST